MIPYLVKLFHTIFFFNYTHLLTYLIKYLRDTESWLCANQLKLIIFLFNEESFLPLSSPEVSQSYPERNQPSLSGCSAFLGPRLLMLLPPLMTAKKVELFVPRIETKAKGDRAFQSVAPRLWKILPLPLSVADSVEVYKKQLKTFYFPRLLCDDFIAFLMLASLYNLRLIFSYSAFVILCLWKTLYK